MAPSSRRILAAAATALVLLLGCTIGMTQAFVPPSAPAPVPARAAAARGSAIAPLHVWLRNPPVPSSAGMAKKEGELLAAIEGLGRREEQNPAEAQARVRALIQELEAAKGVPKPARSPLVNGKWRLLYTLSDGTASPIQRGFVGSRAVTVYQNIDLDPPGSPTAEATVTNLVDFGKLGDLKVQARASTAARPIPGFVPRRGDGRILGLNIFGVSKTEVPASDPDARIDFQFVDAGFDLSLLPFRLPYPVPFRLLGDEVKGWIEVTYLSPRVRISRGNKGTIFVLAKED